MSSRSTVTYVERMGGHEQDGLIWNNDIQSREPTVATSQRRTPSLVHQPNEQLAFLGGGPFLRSWRHTDK